MIKWGVTATLARRHLGAVALILSYGFQLAQYALPISGTRTTLLPLS